ncbi:MAG: xanthine dehydrogenase family protein molybdopterin-binding subunit [Nitrososphaerales archaeon]
MEKQSEQYEQEVDFELGLVGKSVQRVDASPKVSGRITYTRDMVIPFMLHAKVKRSPYAHAKILSIDYSKAMKIPGVAAVVTGRDFPPLGTEETPAMATDEALYAGQAVVAVAAESKLLAEQALNAIDVDYEELPALIDPLVAMSADPPAVIVHDGEKGKPPNIGKHIHVERGDVDRGFRVADFVFEDEYKTSAETHFMMEPLSFIARPDLGGGFCIWGMSSGPHKMQSELSRYLGMDPYKIRAIVTFMGGWFGSKEESHVAAICAMLCIKSSKPVKLELSREETIIATGTRHPTTVKVKDGISRNGKLIARQITAIYDGGAYGLLGNSVIRNAAIAASNVYKIPNFRMDAYRVYTNRTPGTPKRAPIGFQIVFAVESHMDNIAFALKMDPVKLREVNALENGDETVLGETMEGISHKRALEEVKKRLSKYPTNSDSVWKSGKGYSLCAKWSSGGPHQASVRMREDSTIEVWSGVVENGGGTLTSLSQIVADEFGVPIERVRMMPMVLGSDSFVSGAEGGAAASRQLVNHGRAVMLACEDLKRKIAKRASPLLGVPQDDIEIRAGQARSRTNHKTFVDISSFFSRLTLLGVTKISVIADGEEFVGYGTWIEELGQMDEKTGQAIGGRISPYYTTVCQGADVSVNIETGQVRVNRIVAVMDIGKAINPALVHGQIAGSVAMSVGSALAEELVMESGHVVNANLADYKILTSVDMPKIETVIFETPSGNGPFGCRGAGEASSLATPAAVRNAIHDAVGVSINKIPIRPADVLLALSVKGVD